MVMDGWMNRYIDGWVDGWINMVMDRYLMIGG